MNAISVCEIAPEATMKQPAGVRPVRAGGA
jgi:hypothetical protein